MRLFLLLPLNILQFGLEPSSGRAELGQTQDSLSSSDKAGKNSAAGFDKKDCFVSYQVRVWILGDGLLSSQQRCVPGSFSKGGKKMDSSLSYPLPREE